MRRFAERFRELRCDKNLSMKDLSKEINISDATISRWENGINDIKGDQLIIVAKFFGVSADYLLGLED